MMANRLYRGVTASVLNGLLGPSGHVSLHLAECRWPLDQRRGL